MIEVLLIVVAVGSPPPPAPLQGPDPEREARVAARRYESLLRRRAPDRFGGVGSGPCDEIIGRYCFRFVDDGGAGSRPEPEHPDVAAARRLAIRAYRRWLSVDPGSADAAGGLIRYLIEDGRPGEAVPPARAHAGATGAPESLLLLGLALHYTADFEASEAAFDSARSLVAPAARAALDDVGVLLERRERSRYEALDPADRAAYHRRFWALSDPALRVPGNERRSAHYARHAWIGIMAEAPRAAGRLSWGGDDEEVLLRYGLPRNRERIRSPGWRLEADLRLVESYDPHAVSFVPSTLGTEGVPRAPLPGDPGPLERDTVRSSYAPVRLHRMRGLDVQATRIPGPEAWVLRVDAMLPPDTADPAVPHAPEGLLTVLDTLGREVARTPAAVEVRADSVTVVRAEAPVPAGALVYQVEVGDDSTRLAGLARYRIDIRETVPRLSDPLLSHTTPDSVPTGRSDLRPVPTGVLPPDQAVLVYAEARGLLRESGTARYAVEWWLEPVDRGSLLGRALRWMGRSLGLVDDDGGPVRVRWESASPEPDPVLIIFALDLSGAGPGLHRLGIAVRDRATGRVAVTERTVRVDPRAAPLRAPDPD